jgi:hypothetical protein
MATRPRRRTDTTVVARTLDAPARGRPAPAEDAQARPVSLTAA